jgi:hypothetical protein
LDACAVRRKAAERPGVAYPAIRGIVARAKEGEKGRESQSGMSCSMVMPASRPAKSAKADFVVKWDRGGEALRVVGMAKADVAAFLANRDIAELSESAN